MRELERIKRDREAVLEREKERAEIERRREMPEEERLKEDMARAEKSRKEKPKGQQRFMQKYYHKGAFFQVRSLFLSIMRVARSVSRTERTICTYCVGHRVA